MNDAHHRLALPQGTRIQDFEFHRVLGQGGFGITYLGWNIALDIPVAIKEYLPSDLATRENDMSVVPQSSEASADFKWGLDRFLDEARILARFQHANIVRVHHFFEAHSTAYIVMEYAEGETLSQVLRSRKTLDEEELKAILYPILDGLEVVHGADFLHRDVKPGNIIIRDEDNSPVLLDFGAARQAIGARSRSVTSIITPGYAPIEQYSSRGDQGPWTDVYALGAVCYHALTGDVPDDATDRVRNDPLTPVAERCAGQASAGFLAAIDWALKVDERDRPQSVGAWRTTLSGKTPGTAKKPRPVVKPAKGRPPRSRQREIVNDSPVRQPGKRKGPLFAAVLVCVLALLIGGGYYYYENIHLPAQRRQAQEGEQTAKISALLSGAAEDLARDRLTSPAGNNAWEKYQEVLALAPGQKEASAGLDSVIGRYVTKFDASLRTKEFDKAEEYVSRIRGAWVDAPVLSSLTDRLSAARGAEQRRQREARRERLAAEEAERLHQAKVADFKRKFEESLGRKDFDAAGRYVESLRSVNASARLLSQLGDRLSSARAAERSRQEAERARRAAEEAERLRQAKIERYKGKFEEALEDEAFDRADGYVDSLRAVDAEASTLSGLVRGLSAGREAQRLRGTVGGKFRDCADCPEMVVVPSGSFMMGSPGGEEGRYDNEGPRHRVVIGYRFAVGVYEVTFAQWDACASAGGCGGYRPSDRGWGRGNRPVINVSWDDAQLYVQWLSEKTGARYRLLSESEWEYVARAETTTPFHFGSTISTDQANYNGKHTYGGGRKGLYREKTVSVGSFSANGWGLYDVHGNVWEWVEDCGNDSYTGAPAEGSAWERGDCSKRVLRGGSWYVYPGNLRAADRDGNTAGKRNDVIGFRIARTLTP